MQLTDHRCAEITDHSGQQHTVSLETNTLLLGETGSGKTHALRTIATTAASQGYPVVSFNGRRNHRMAHITERARQRRVHHSPVVVLVDELAAAQYRLSLEDVERLTWLVVDRRMAVVLTSHDRRGPTRPITAVLSSLTDIGASTLTLSR